MYAWVEATWRYLPDILGAVDWVVALNAAATAVIAWATVLIWKSNLLANRIAVGETMPILNFRVDRKEAPAWIVENVGKGVALNVQIAHETQDGEVEEPVRDYNALRPGKACRIRWKHEPFKFVAQYTDVYGQRYACVCVGSVNSVRNGWVYEGWGEKAPKPLWRMVVSGEIEPDEDTRQQGDQS